MENTRALPGERTGSCDRSRVALGRESTYSSGPALSDGNRGQSGKATRPRSHRREGPDLESGSWARTRKANGAR